MKQNQYFVSKRENEMEHSIPQPILGLLHAFFRGIVTLSVCILMPSISLSQSYDHVDTRLERRVAHLFGLAANGDGRAKYQLGVAYEKGLGVSKSFAAAVQWYREAAEEGIPEAQNELGLAYAEGKGVSQDYMKAVEWYRKAVESGLKEAQYNLGFSYYKGLGLPRDLGKAFECFLKSATQGFSRAQFQVALMYANGEGICTDFEEALAWLRKSADGGHLPAKDLLIKMNLQFPR